MGSRCEEAQRTELHLQVAEHKSKASTDSRSRSHCETISTWYCRLVQVLVGREWIANGKQKGRNACVPEDIRSSPNRITSIPCSSWRAKSIPDLVNRSIESWAYISSLPRYWHMRQQIFCVHMSSIRLPQAELEIELPCWTTFSKVAILIGEWQSKLNNLEQIYIAPKCLVLVFCLSWEGPNRTCNNPWKLSVLEAGTVRTCRSGLWLVRHYHRHIAVLLNDLPNDWHFLL